MAGCLLVAAAIGFLVIGGLAGAAWGIVAAFVILVILALLDRG